MLLLLGGRRPRNQISDTLASLEVVSPRPCARALPDMDRRLAGLGAVLAGGKVYRAGGKVTDKELSSK